MRPGIHLDIERAYHTHWLSAWADRVQGPFVATAKILQNWNGKGPGAWGLPTLLEDLRDEHRCARLHLTFVGDLEWAKNLTTFICRWETFLGVLPRLALRFGNEREGDDSVIVAREAEFLKHVAPFGCALSVGDDRGPLGTLKLWTLRRQVLPPPDFMEVQCYGRDGWHGDHVQLMVDAAKRLGFHGRLHVAEHHVTHPKVGEPDQPELSWERSGQYMHEFALACHKAGVSYSAFTLRSVCVYPDVQNALIHGSDAKAWAPPILSKLTKEKRLHDLAR